MKLKQKEIQSGRRLMNKFYEIRFKEHVIIESSDGSTFRAIETKNHSPSLLFRNWAYHFFFQSESVMLKELKKVRSKAHFEAIHTKSCVSLTKYWHRTEKNSIEFRYASKLVDLLFKYLIGYHLFSKKQTELLKKYIHVPLDKFVLNKLSKLENNYSFPISLKGVTRRNYKHIQNKIKYLLDKNPPILFDFIAWDLSHSLIDKIKINNNKLVNYSKKYNIKIY